ncbi:hypothetical protein DSECCO2_630450 [anaerobic digester metagenome]
MQEKKGQKTQEQERVPGPAELSAAQGAAQQDDVRQSGGQAAVSASVSGGWTGQAAAGAAVDAPGEAQDEAQACKAESDGKEVHAAPV